MKKPDAGSISVD